MVTGGSGAIKGTKAWRVSRLRHTIWPVVSVPTRWKLFCQIAADGGPVVLHGTRLLVVP
jgi:hypothetical protein